MIHCLLCKETVNTIKYVSFNVIKRKDKGHPRTGHEGPEGEKRYSSTLSWTSALDGGGWVVDATPRPLYPQERDPVPIV